jgi:hypothetical protein
MKPLELFVPVLQTFLVKELKESESLGPFILGTFVQRTFGLSGEEKGVPFAYRFNNDSTDDKGLVLRRIEHSKCKIGSMNNVEISRFTEVVRAPVQFSMAFDQYPFTILCATAEIELSTREDKSKRNIRLRPNLIIDKNEIRHCVSVQNENGIQSQILTKSSDKLLNYSFVTPYPQLSFIYDDKKKYCPVFRVSLMMKKDGMPKFISIILPALLVSVLTTLNWYTANNNNNKSGVVNDYLINATLIAIIAAVSLPHMSRSRMANQIFTLYDAYVVFLFVSLALASIPPSLTAITTMVCEVGVILVWVSLAFPLNSLARYLFQIHQIKQEHGRSGLNHHPLAKTSLYKDWTSEKMELMHYVEWFKANTPPDWKGKELNKKKHEMTFVGGKQ